MSAFHLRAKKENALSTEYDREVAANKKRRATNWPSKPVMVRVYDSWKHGEIVKNPTVGTGARLSRRDWRAATKADRRRAIDAKQRGAR